MVNLQHGIHSLESKKKNLKKNVSPVLPAEQLLNKPQLLIPGKFQGFPIDKLNNKNFVQREMILTEIMETSKLIQTRGHHRLCNDMTTEMQESFLTLSSFPPQLWFFLTRLWKKTHEGEASPDKQQLTQLTVTNQYTYQLNTSIWLLLSNLMLFVYGS